MRPEALLPALLASAAAIGLSPYAALSAQGLAAALGLIVLPASLAGLGSPWVWLPLTLIALVQGALSHLRTADLVWGSLHTLIAPLAALLLASTPLTDRPPAAAWLAAAAAFVVALLVQVDMLGTHVAAWTAGPARGVGRFTICQLAGAAFLASLAWGVPSYAIAWTALIVLAPLPRLPRLLGAAALPMRALALVLARPARSRRWGDIEALPNRLREVATAELAGTGSSLRNIRSSPATLSRWGPGWPYRPGWLVQEEGQSPLFVGRRGLGAVALRLGPGRARLEHGILVETLEVEGAWPYALCLDASSPGAPAILAAIERGGRDLEPPRGGRV